MFAAVGRDARRETREFTEIRVRCHRFVCLCFSSKHDFTIVIGASFFILGTLLNVGLAFSGVQGISCFTKPYRKGNIKLGMYHMILSLLDADSINIGPLLQKMLQASLDTIHQSPMQRIR